jgi:hypothetical protein
MRQGRTQWCGGESGFTPWRPRWGLERKALELGAWRMELEVRLMGAMLHGPRIGLLRADECGLTDQRFDRDDMRLMYQAVCCCEQNGMLDDKTLVLAMVRAALCWGRFWIRDAHRNERGFWWSEANLVDLACGGDDGPGDVREYARQLIELDEAVAEARKLWQQMIELLDHVGYVKELDGTCRATPMKSPVNAD